MSQWFFPSWWAYVFGMEYTRKPYRLSWRVISCRIRGHPCGIVFFAGPLATEPDTHCKDCGDDLG